MCPCFFNWLICWTNLLCTALHTVKLNVDLCLSRVDLGTDVTVTSNPVVVNDNRTGAILVFVQGSDGQVCRLHRVFDTLPDYCCP